MAIRKQHPQEILITLFMSQNATMQLGSCLDVKIEPSQRRHKITSLGRTFHDMTYLHDQSTSIIRRNDVLLMTSQWSCRFDVPLMLQYDVFRTIYLSGQSICIGLDALWRFLGCSPSNGVKDLIRGQSY